MTKVNVVYAVMCEEGRIQRGGSVFGCRQDAQKVADDLAEFMDSKYVVRRLKVHGEIKNTAIVRTPDEWYRQLFPKEIEGRNIRDVRVEMTKSHFLSLREDGTFERHLFKRLKDGKA